MDAEIYKTTFDLTSTKVKRLDIIPINTSNTLFIQPLKPAIDQFAKSPLPTTKMQFSLLTTVVTLLLSASVAHAGVMDLLASRQTKQCEYVKENYLSRCTAAPGGGKDFCSGNDNVCKPQGKTDGFDAVAKKANEDICVGKRQADSCMQTIQCC